MSPKLGSPGLSGWGVCHCCPSVTIPAEIAWPPNDRLIYGDRCNTLPHHTGTRLGGG
jgi:hypothetical protein